MIKREMPTLTQARKELAFDDLRTIGLLADFFCEMLDNHPDEVVEHFFSGWMRETCKEVDEGRRIGSGTQSMLEFYRQQSEGIAIRLSGPPRSK